jgi:hypothetical protein
LSTKIESFGNAATSTPNLKRVIVGFNVFLHDVGPIVQNAPEHSHVFNEKVKLQRQLQRQRRQQQQPNGGNSGGRVSLQVLQSNPQLAKLLVLAKRQKVKQDLCQAQMVLTQQIVALLLAKQQSDDEQQQQQQQPDYSRAAGLTVADLMQQSCRENSNKSSNSSPSSSSLSSSSLLSFPTPVDVQVHIHHLCRQGILQIVVPLSNNHGNGNSNDSSSLSRDDIRNSTIPKTNSTMSCTSKLISPSQRVRLPHPAVVASASLQNTA